MTWPRRIRATSGNPHADCFMKRAAFQGTTSKNICMLPEDDVQAWRFTRLGIKSLRCTGRYGPVTREPPAETAFVQELGIAETGSTLANDP